MEKFNETNETKIEELKEALGEDFEKVEKDLEEAEAQGEEGYAKILSSVREKIGGKAKTLASAVLFMLASHGEAKTTEMHTEDASNPETEMSVSATEDAHAEDTYHVSAEDFGDKKGETKESVKEVNLVEDEAGDVYIIAQMEKAYDIDLGEDDQAPEEVKELKKTGVEFVKEVSETREAKVKLVDREKLGFVGVLKNSDGKYALDIQVKGNTIVMYWNNDNHLARENIEKVLNSKSFSKEALKLINKNQVKLELHANGNTYQEVVNL